jgi:glycerol-3-phosphate dehydrogenase
MPDHKFHSRKKSLEQRPLLNPDIVATATYYDAWMPYPERICMEMILDAEALHDGARALNYVSAADAQGDSVTLRDELTGQTLTVRPQIVVNAAGPWIDFANRAMNRPTTFIGGAKGSHLVLDHPQLHEATGGHELFFENADGRITLFFPLLDRVLVGTTDIPIDNPDDARCTDDEIDYMLSLVRRVFPSLDLGREHVVFTFTGVRPLPASDAATPGQISRDHSIRVVEPDDQIAFPIYALVGGKWTTFRAFSEQTTDRLLQRLGHPRRDSTRDMAIGGGRDYPATAADRDAWLDELHHQTELPREQLAALFDRYGTRAADIARYISDGNDEPLAHVPGYTRREVTYLAEYEMIVRLDDLILRRSLLAMTGKLDAESLPELAAVLGKSLGWDKARTNAEVERAQATLKTHHRVELAEGPSLA